MSVALSLPRRLLAAGRQYWARLRAIGRARGAKERRASSGPQWPDRGGTRPWDEARDQPLCQAERQLAGPHGAPWGFPPTRPWPGVVRQVGVSRSWMPWRRWRQARTGADARALAVEEFWTGTAWQVLSQRVVRPAQEEGPLDALGRPRWRYVTGRDGRRHVGSVSAGPERPLTLWALSSEQEAMREFFATCPADFPVAPVVARMLEALATDPAVTWLGPRKKPVALGRLLLSPSLRPHLETWAQGETPSAIRALLVHRDREVRALGIQLAGIMADRRVATASGRRGDG